MEEKTKKALDKILDSYSSKQDAVRKEVTRQKTEREQFLERFKEKATTLIRPLFEKVGEHLKSRGHDFGIKEENERIEGDGKRHSNAGITLEIYPERKRPSFANHGCPHVAIMVDSHKNSLYVYESTMMPGSGGRSGSAGSYELDAITPEIIDKHIIGVLSQAMGAK